MSFLSSAALAAVSKGSVKLALLAHFDFVDDPRRYWMGFGPLRTLDSANWEGTAGVGEISGLNVPIGTVAQQVSFSLSGVDARVAKLARRQSDLVKGRAVTVYVQIFNEDWSPLGTPLHVWSGELDVMSWEQGDDGTFVVKVSAESIWAARRKSPFGFYTDADQQARSPGDRGLELMASLPGKTITWPL